VANPEPAAIEQPALMERLASMIESRDRTDETITSELQLLARACTASVLGGTNEADFTQARFAEAVREVEALVTEELTEGQEDAISFLTVQTFALLFRLDWLVIGST
jgi:hypothetical protein